MARVYIPVVAAAVKLNFALYGFLHPAEASTPDLILRWRAAYSAIGTAVVLLTVWLWRRMIPGR